jgi:hypothetical protein
MSAFTVMTNSPGSSNPSRRTVVNPVSVKVRVYMPGLSSMIRYCPVSSVVAVRTFSINAGLDASTVTPGKTAPDVSLTTPVMDDCCADVMAGRSTRSSETNATWVSLRMSNLLSLMP